MNLLTLKTLNPGSAYCCGDILSEDGETLATNVDSQLEEILMTVDTSRGNCAPWDEDSREVQVTEVLGYELAYETLGMDLWINLPAGNSERENERLIGRYIDELRKGATCLV